MNTKSADASFDLLLRRFLRGENFAFDVLRYHVGVGNVRVLARPPLKLQ